MSDIKQTPVSHVVALAAIVKMGLTVERQSQFTKVTGPVSGRAVYVSNAADVVRVDFSGFTHPLGRAWNETLKKQPSPRVLQTLDQRKGTPLEVLKDLVRVLRDALIENSANARSLDSAETKPQPTKEEIEALLASVFEEKKEEEKGEEQAA